MSVFLNIANENGESPALSASQLQMDTRHLNIGSILDDRCRKYAINKIQNRRGQVVMHDWIARKNIEHYQELLLQEKDPGRRDTLRKLLKEAKEEFDGPNESVG